MLKVFEITNILTLFVQRIARLKNKIPVDKLTKELYSAPETVLRILNSYPRIRAKAKQAEWDLAHKSDKLFFQTQNNRTRFLPQVTWGNFNKLKLT